MTGDARPIVVFADRPSQVSAPIHRRLAGVPGVRLHVVFYAPDWNRSRVDPESGQAPTWDMDLLGGYQHRVLPPGAKRWWRLLQLVASSDYRLLIVPGWGDAVCRAALVSAVLLGRPVAVGSDTVSFERRRGLRAWVRQFALRLILGRVRAGIATGSLAAAELRALGLAGDRVFAVPYVVDAHFIERHYVAARAGRHSLRQALGISADATVFMAALKLVPREGVEDLIRAFENLPQSEGPSCCLWVVGDGPLRPSLERRVRDKRIFFRGRVSYTNFVSHLAAADVFVHPAMHENWGVSITEALLCRLPVIASTGVGAAHDLIAPDRTGTVYPRGDVDALRDAMARFASMPAAQRTEMGEAGRRAALQVNDVTWREEFCNLLGCLDE